MKKYLLFLFFFIAQYTTEAQLTLGGTVKNVDGQPVAGTSLKLYKNGIIVTFAITDAKGNFSLQIKTQTDSLQLAVSHIGYVSQQIKITAPYDAPLAIILAPLSISLPEVKIKAPPISKKGDTLNYDVRAFSSQQDRVIGDVIKKLPGIEVGENGQIKYNGKAISNYYIDGLDLLENKYNLANNNISLDLVDKVQILENHQQLRILDSTVAATSPALNIKLKDNAKSKLYVNATAGGGYDTSFLWNMAVTAMKFSKNKQFLNGLKVNNTGDDFSAELTEHLTLDNLDQVPRFERKNDLLFLQKPQLPSIKKERFTFNNSKLGFLNGLFLLNKKAQLKYNVTLLWDKQRNWVESGTKYFLGTDTIAVTENQSFTNYNKTVKANLKYTYNQPTLYISNKLSYTGHFDEANGQISGTSNLLQQLDNPYYYLSNELMIYKKIKKQLFQLNSYIVLRSAPQLLDIYPGQFTDVFNGGQPFQSLGQSVNKKDFLFSNILSTKTSLFKFQQKFSLQVDYLTNKLTSDLQKVVNNNPSSVGNGFQNNLIWNKLSTELRPDFMFFRKSFKITLSTPLSIINLATKDALASQSKTRHYTFFVPSLMFYKPINQFFELNVNLNSSATIGNIVNTATGFIMSNYRIISNNEDVIAVDKSSGASILLSYRNGRKAIFSYVSGLYSETNRNLIYSQQYTQTLLTSKAIPLANAFKNYQLIGNFGKYFPKSKITTSINLSYNHIRSFLYTNALIPFNNTAIAAKYNINTKGIKSFFVEYIGSLIQSKSSISGSKNTVLQSAHDLNVFAFISKQISLGTYFSYNTNKSNQLNHYFFTDLGLSFKNQKHEIDFKLNNLFNTRQFLWSDVNENNITTINYRIRPLNVVLRYTFKF